MQTFVRWVAVAGVLLAVSALQAEEQITIAGSSTVKPIVEQAAKAFEKDHAGVKFVIGGGGSSKGVKLAGSGEVMIGMASRDIKDKEKAEFSDLAPVKIGLDGIAIVVHKDNPLTKITKQQVQDIYTGVITNWKDVGGPDAAIELTAMGTTHGTHELFLEYFELEAEAKGKELAHKKKSGGELSKVLAKSVESSKDGMAAVMTNANAIAYVSIGAVQKVAEKGGKVKAVDLDGVAATTDNVANGKYPLRRNLLVMTKGQPSGMVKDFVDFLTSAAGQKIVTDLDFIAVK